MDFAKAILNHSTGNGVFGRGESAANSSFEESWFFDLHLCPGGHFRNREFYPLDKHFK